MRIPKCNSPRPETTHVSVLGMRATRRATSFCVSLNNLSSIFLAVNNFPSLPQKGEVLVPKVICKVGSSNLISGRGSMLFILLIVSPTLMSVKPATATISPAKASLISNL